MNPTSGEWVRRAVGGVGWLAPPNLDDLGDDDLDRKTFMALAGISFNAVGLDAVAWRTVAPWQVVLRQATGGDRPLAVAHVMPNAVWQLLFQPHQWPRPQPFWLEAHDGFGDLSLFVPLVRRGNEREPLVLVDSSERLRAALV